MAWLPISGIVPQATESGNQADGMVLKFYEPGTLTPLEVATNSAGTTTTVEFILNSQGYTTLSTFELIPHVSQVYKAVLYLDQTDADANDTGSAVWEVDNVNVGNFSALLFNTYDNLADAIAASSEDVGNFLATCEYTAGTGVGGGKYQKVSVDPGDNLVNPATTDSNWLKFIPDAPYIMVEQAGAIGDFDVNAANGNPASNVGTDDTLSIQAAVDYAANNFDAIDSNPSTINTSLRNFAGGGEVRCKSGSNYLISDTIKYQPRALIDMQGASFCADTTAVWTDKIGPICNWVEVNSGGTGYSSSFAVTFTSDGTTDPVGVAYSNQGVITHIYITNNGAGLSSAPTADLSAGGGSGASVTAELAVIGQPLVENEAPAGVFTVWEGGIKNGYLWGRGVADCFRAISIKANQSSEITCFEGKYTGVSLLGCDRNDFFDFSVYDCGLYNIYITGNWDIASLQPSQENKFRGGNSQYGSRTCVFTDTSLSNSNRFDMTFRQSVGDSPKGSELIIGGGNTGSQLSGAKIEHDSANPNPVIVITGGAGHELDFNAAPNNPTVHYKWIRNAGGNDVNVYMYSAESVMSSRPDNPNLAGDISPFESVPFRGINGVKLPFTSDSRLRDVPDWCRDMDGNDQAATQYNMSRFTGGWGSGLNTQKLDLQAPASAEVTVRSGVSGESFERLRVMGTGELRWGDGSSAASEVRLGRTSSGLEVKSAGTTSGTVVAIIEATVADLTNISSTINTVGKFKGRQVIDGTSGAILYSNNSADSGTWKNSGSGAVVHTPV